ncbi:hypothetical protein BX666DRAFT_1946255 [Dichotomocladium elegans]|nr:hypothetical protein BX666DRAFT_1946255 [Dichotomocladium elegans]
MARKIVLACRNVEKGEAAVAEIKQATGNDKVVCMELDLLSLEAVKQFAKTFQEKYKRLDILMNNAGAMMCPMGVESQFATNHLAPYYLTILLLPLLEQSPSSRIVNVSSMAHLLVHRGFSYEKISKEKAYNPIWLYSITKACNILFTRELSRRLEAKGVHNVYVNCSHPGTVQSEFSRYVANPGLWRETRYIEMKKIKAKYYVPYAKPGWTTPFTSSAENAARLWGFH